MGSSYKYLRGSDGTGNAVLAHITSPRSIGSTAIVVDSLSKWSPFYIVTTGTLDVNGYMTPSSMTEMYAHSNAGQIIIDGFVPGYSDVGNTSGQVAIVKPTNHFANSVVDQALVSQNDDGTLKTTALDLFYKPGEISPYSFVFSGGIIAQTTGLNASFSDIIYYLNGLRYTKTGVAVRAYTASKDTYVDIDNTGTLYYTEVANGATTGFTLTAGRIRLAKVVTSGAAVTSVTQKGVDALQTVVYPLPSLATDRMRAKHYFRVNRTAAANSPAGTTAVTIFDTKEYDFGNNYNTTTGIFTVPEDGVWQFTGHQSLGSASTSIFIVLIGKNGTDAIRGVDLRVASTNKSGMVSDELYCVAGDQISIRLFTDVSVAFDVTAPSALNTFSGHLVGKA